MKIIYIGKCNSMASKLVNRFVKDENDVYIISSKDFAKDVKPSLIYKLYTYQSENIEIEKVFRSIKPDVVIFASDIYTDNCWNYSPETNIYLTQLLNILNKSVMNDVGKFIYLSTDEVYNPLTEVIFENSEIKPTTYKGILCSQAEALVSKFHEMYRLDYVILRISSIYGFSINEKQNDFISSIMNNFHKKGEYSANKNKYFSPLHIKDVVEAIYRTKDTTSSFVYNVSGKEKISEFKAAALLNDLTGQKYHVLEEDGEAFYYNCNTLAIKKELEWVQFHTFEDEFPKQDFSFAEKVKEDKAKKKKIPNAAFRLIENSLLFVFFVFLTFISQQYEVFRSIDLFYFYIILIALLFGVKQSIFSIALSSAFFIFHTDISVTSIIDVLINIECILKIAQYIFIGTVIGYSVDSYKVTVQEKDVEYDYLKNEYDEIKEINDDNIIIKHEYERRLISYKTSLPKLYSIISQLTVLEPAKIFSAIIHVVKEVLGTKTAAVYVLNSGSEYARLMVSLNQESVFQGNSFNINDFPNMKRTLFENEIYISNQWNDNEPSLAAPIFHKGQCVAIIIINEMPFRSLTIYNINLFRTLSILITSSVVKANEYEEAIREYRYIPNTHILMEKEFLKVIEIKKEDQKQGLSKFTLIRIDSEDRLIDRYYKICNMFRTTDFFGVNDKNELFVLLGNTPLADAEYAIKRLEAKGNQITVVDSNLKEKALCSN